MPEEQITNWSQLARALGVSKQLMDFHRRKTPGAPTSMSVKDWTQFFNARGYAGANKNKSDKQVAKEMAKAKLEILQHTRHKLARDNKIKDNKIYDAAEVHRFHENLIRFFFGELTRISREFPVLLKGKDELSIETVCMEQEKQIKQALTDKLELWKREHPDENTNSL